MTDYPVVECLSLGAADSTHPVAITSVEVKDVADLDRRARALLWKEIATGTLDRFVSELSREGYVLVIGKSGDVNRIRSLLTAHEAELCR
jgi:hypothetical protein